jgi:hypothetical protein
MLPFAERVHYSRQGHMGIASMIPSTFNHFSSSILLKQHEDHLGYVLLSKHPRTASGLCESHLPRQYRNRPAGSHDA